MIKLKVVGFNFIIIMFKDYNQNQNQLLPANISAQIKSDHLARLISYVIDNEIDIAHIERTYSANGQHAYHPRMLFKVLAYGYAVGLRSSRKLADRLQEDLAFMWLSGRQTPDFRTIADFRKDKLDDIKKTFVQILDLCRQIGLVRVGKVYPDGTKIRADVSANKMQYRKVLLSRQVRIKQQVDDIFREAEAIDREEDNLYGNRTAHSTGLSLGEAKRKLVKLNRRQRTLGRQQAKLAAKEKDINGKLRRMRKDRNTMSSVDKDATLMLMKEGHIAPAYNAQLATERQVILAYDLSSNRNDQKLLKPLIEAVADNTGKKPKIVVADAGYGRKMNYRYLRKKKIAAFIPYANFNKERVERNQGVYEPPKKIDGELEKYKARQRLRLLSPAGKELIKRRRQDIEPVIGDIKRNMNFRTFHLRGKPKCLIELGLVCLGHNLKKIKQWTKKLAEWNDGQQKGIELGTILGYRPV